MFEISLLERLMVFDIVSRESAVHGLGIFATRRLVLGDIVMVDDPVLVTPTGLTPETRGYIDKMFDSLNSQFQKLDSSKQVRCTYSKRSGSSVISPCFYVFRIRKTLLRT